MTRRNIADRIAEQFSGESERADIWRGLDLVLDTRSYLNLGYSGRYQTHLLGSPQGRLVERVVDRAASLRADPVGERLLDVGCGRGVPTAYAAAEHAFDAVGVDLVPYNLDLARENVADVPRKPAFVVGDASRLPFDAGAFSVCVAIDSIVYVADTAAVYGELERVLERGGHAVVADLVAAGDAVVDRRTLERFGRAWDMPAPTPFDEYVEAIEASGLTVLDATNVSANSVGGFRKWTAAYLALADGPTGPVLDRLLRRLGVDPAVVTGQIRVAHAVLPALRHVIVTLEDG